jgi:hypothetical protein
MAKLKVRPVSDASITSSLRERVDNYVRPAVESSVTKLGLDKAVATEICAKYLAAKVKYRKDSDSLRPLPNPNNDVEIFKHNGSLDDQSLARYRNLEKEIATSIISACGSQVFADQVQKAIKLAEVDYDTAVRKSTVSQKQSHSAELKDLILQQRKNKGPGSEKYFVDQFGLTSEEMLFLAEPK